MKGEAGKYPTLLQQDLHIISVGSAPREGENAADELLRQLITLPRPVRVEFAKTAPATPAAASPSPPSPPTPAPESFKNDQPLQKEELKTTPPLPVQDAHSRAEKEHNHCEREEREKEPGGHMALEPPLGKHAGHRETGEIVGESLPSTGGEERQQGESAGHDDDERNLVAGADDEESRRGASQRPPPQRHGTLPSAGWQEGRVDVVGVGGDDENNAGQRPQGAAGRRDGAETERREKPDRNNDEGLLATSEEKHEHAPRRPQRHGTLPEGIDWEENLRSGRGGDVDPRTTAAAATQSVGEEESEEARSWSIPEEVNFRSSPTNGSQSSTRPFHGPNARRSHLVLTPEGSESSAWSNGRVQADGVDSIQRWLQVRRCLARCQTGVISQHPHGTVDSSSRLLGLQQYYAGYQGITAFPKRSKRYSAQRLFSLYICTILTKILYTPCTLALAVILTKPHPWLPWLCVHPARHCYAGPVSRTTPTTATEN